MNTLKIKVICDGHIIGLIMITRNNPNFANYVVGTIVPITRQGEWNVGDLTLVFGQQISDIYQHSIPIDQSNEEIINDLLSKANINRANCKNFQLTPY